MYLQPRLEPLARSDGVVLHLLCNITKPMAMRRAPSRTTTMSGFCHGGQAPEKPKIGGRRVFMTLADMRRHIARGAAASVNRNVHMWPSPMSATSARPPDFQPAVDVDTNHFPQWPTLSIFPLSTALNVAIAAPELIVPSRDAAHLRTEQLLHTLQSYLSYPRHSAIAVK